MFYPLFLDLRDRPVLVVGGGEVAERKVESLLEAGATVTVVAPDVTPLFRRLRILEPFVYRSASSRKRTWTARFS